MLDQLLIGVNVFGLLIAQQQAEEQRRHERDLKEIEMIANSAYRDQFVAEMLVDRLLAPIEKAQFTIQNTAKHAQYLAEAVWYHHGDHGLDQKQAREVAKHLRYLAVLLSNIDSLHQLRLVYTVTTLFTDIISVFKHRERKYSIEHSIRHDILNPLNDCIASYENFKRRTGISV